MLKGVWIFYYSQVVDIKFLTRKGMWCYLTYIVAQLYPPMLSLSGAIMGLGASPMWTGFATYITRVCEIC